MPGKCTATGFPSGISGRFAKRGGHRMLVEGIGWNTSNRTGWSDSTAFVDGTAPGVRNFGAHFNSSRSQVRQQWLITGTTKDKNGNSLPNCQVTLFKTVDNLPCATTASDVNGNYVFSIDGNSQARFAVSYLAGNPDVAGTTVNTLVPVLT